MVGHEWPLDPVGEAGKRTKYEETWHEGGR